MPSAEPRRFTADELLHGAPLDQFIRILFALGEEETFYQSFPGVPRGAASTQLTARGLTPCTGYRLRARARNSKGEGPWSPAFTCSTLEEVLPPLSCRLLAAAP